MIDKKILKKLENQCRRESNYHQRNAIYALFGLIIIASIIVGSLILAYGR